MSKEKVFSPDSYRTSENKGFEEIDDLIAIYNKSNEGDVDVETEINNYILSNQWLKNAIKKVGKGTVTEVGPYKGTFLQTLSQQFSQHLQDAFVLGIDAGHYEIGPIAVPHKETSFENLIQADRNQILHAESISNSPNEETSIWQLKDSNNSYALYGVPAELALARGAKADLMILKFVMGYLLEYQTIKTLEYSLFSKAKSIFMIDYVGKTHYTKTQIPRPETIARYMPGMEVIYEQHQKHFILFAAPSL